MGFKGGCIFFLITNIFLVIADKDASSNGVYVKALGQSGKIMVGKTENPAQDPDGVKVEFDEIKEKDSSGNEVGKTGSKKHSFNTFANQAFEFTSIEDVEYENISAKGFNFSADLTSVDATLMVSVYIFSENGSIVVANETTEVEAGTVKFNIEVKNWGFCGTTGYECKQGQANEVGEFLDFVIVIKGKGNASKEDEEEGGEDKEGDQYNLGGGAEVTLSKKVKYDNGDWVDMPEGYPMFSTNGEKQTFTFRFDKFSDSVLYDPTINVGKDDGDGGDDNGGDSEGSSKTASAGNVYTKTQGKSGQITIGTTSNPSQDPNRVIINFDALKEVQSDDSTITDNGHSFNTFASQDFTFTQITDTTVYNVSAKTFTFNATVGTQQASVAVVVYIFKEAGEIDVDGEKSNVKEGTVKFSMEISGWNFCGTVACNPEATGEFLDFYITVKGKGNKPEKEGEKKMSDGDEYDLGGGGQLVMSKKVKLDGVWKNMEAGYPKLIQQGSKHTFVIRMNKFNQTAFYDPMVTMNNSDSSGGMLWSFSLSVLMMTSLFYYLYGSIGF